MSKKKIWIKKNEEEIDAILPFMSLLLIIIPVLLSNLGFYQFRIVEVSTPGTPKESSAPLDQKEINKDKMVTAYLELFNNKAKLSFLDEDTAEPISSQEESLDNKGAKLLFELLKKNKKDYPKLENLMLKISKNLDYDKMASFLTFFKQPLEGLSNQKKKNTMGGPSEFIKSKSINIVLLREFAEQKMDSSDNNKENKVE